jgi:small subunit ribosomal protein S6e
MKFVVSTKSGKAYSATSDQETFIGKKIGDIVKLDGLGLTGFEAKITGGSDKDVFPMYPTLSGAGRKKIFTANSLGFKATRKGEKKRVSVRGNTIGTETTQINLVITKEGSADINAILGKKEVNPEETMTAKELALKKAKEMAGSAEIGDAIKKKARR